MKPDRWERIVALFEQALRYTGEERERFLDEAAADDAELRSHVAAMLRADEAVHPLLDATPHDLADAVAEIGVPAYPSLAGRRIGPYRLIREIGRGGMGTVYLAEREDVHRRVALKLVAGGLASPERVERFLVERYVLAQLEHPHIARLYDAGVAEDGTPWLAMEYVDGRSIDAWCNARRLGVDARLALFEQVCDAVAYAHRHLVVHRDLKPSNILVTEDGELKLVDFGIAKLLDDSVEAQVLTRTGAAPLTPRYAAPEQLAGGPITTATDVYQLGVLLSTLLDGVRQASGRALNRRGGDLDAIVQMALRPEPERRYASAQQLAEDIRRFRTGRPVIARPDTLRYRAAKFVRRNRAAVAAASVVVLSLLGGAAGMAWQARRAAYAARVAAAERDRAALEAAKAEQVAAFLVDVFRASDPGKALGRNVTARELLRRGAARLGEEGELAAQPEVRAELLLVLGQIYTNLGWRAEARDMLEQALALRRGHLAPNDPALVASLTELANLHIYLGQPAAARPLYDEALAILRTAPDSAARSDVATVLNGLAAVHMANAAHDTAEALLREAVALRRGREDEAELLAQNLNGLGVVLSQNGNLDAADSAFTEALALQRERLDPRHPDLARSLNNVGIVKQRRGDAAAAESYFREALAIWREVLGRHPDVAAALNNLGATLEAQGKLEDAEAAYRESLELKRELIGGDHPSIASSLNNLGLVLVRLERFGEAEPLLTESLEMRRRLHGNDHPDVARAYHNLADLNERRGELERAERDYEQALEIRRTRLGTADPLTLATALSLARVKYARGDAAGSAALLGWLIEVGTPARPASDTLLAEARRQLDAIRMP